MSLTIINRPIGHRLNVSDIDAVIIDDGTGDALIYTGSAHGLSDGDYVYIESNLDSYNGFKYVDQIAYDSFKIKDSENGDFVEFVQNADISYRASVLNHGWQSVHLPIVYELESDLWPNNVAEESYNPNSVDSHTENNGKTQLNLDKAISPTPQALNYIELVGTGPLAGPYKILEVLQPWSIIIDLAYSSANTFGGYIVTNYYNNYAINVNVWAGLDSGHRWASKKPYELAATLKFIPDSEGKIKFSISDVLKGYITTRNNLTLDTLPNNLDFHTSFYIEYFESYDLSDGETIETFEGSTTVDTFEGHAVNSMMPFKSLNMGHMSDYVNQDTFLARWLTLFDRPMAVVDRFFDLSFLNQYSGFDIVVTMYKSLSGVVTDAETLTIENPGLGVIRVPITPESGFDQYCIQAKSSGSVLVSLSTLQNHGSGNSWTTGANPSVSTSADSKILYKLFNFIAGADYTITLIYNGNMNSLSRVFVRVYDLAFSTLFSQQDFVSSGSNTVVLTFTGTEDSMVLGIEAQAFSGPTAVVTLESLEVLVAEQNITEQICIDIIDECSGTFVNDQLRLLEGGSFRELE